ncbi:hypothetical protein V1512DRAFT_289133 [Lipomyces arxii]|uniref:uncharacterized protein n=1 Tax=Lipomyces arxii TaxID=56418 RepID=UPI0034CFE411
MSGLLRRDSEMSRLHNQSNNQSHVFASCAFISSMILIFLFTGPMMSISNNTEIGPVPMASAIPAVNTPKLFASPDSELYNRPSPLVRRRFASSRYLRKGACDDCDESDEKMIKTESDDDMFVQRCVIEPALFSPPEHRTGQGYIIIVVGVITIVTASLMM